MVININIYWPRNVVLLLVVRALPCRLWGCFHVCLCLAPLAHALVLLGTRVGSRLTGSFGLCLHLHLALVAVFGLPYNIRYFIKYHLLCQYFIKYHLLCYAQIPCWWQDSRQQKGIQWWSFIQICQQNCKNKKDKVIWLSTKKYLESLYWQLGVLYEECCTHEVVIKWFFLRQSIFFTFTFLLG